MLKGKMTIELTDVRTGEKQTVVEHNMVTDALAEIFRPLGLAKSPGKLLSSFAPYYTNLTAGLLLFDTAIPEDGSQLYPPAEANLIGCGVYNTQNNTTGTLRGGYNQTESELNLTDRYMKYVYDFTTSQANGTISSVCLTHLRGGYNGYGGRDAVCNSTVLGMQVCDGTLQYVYTNYTGANTGDKYSGYTVGTTELLFLIDRETDSAYYFRINSATSITIIRRRAYLKTVSILENPNTTKKWVEETELTLSTALLSTGYVSYYFDIADNCLYLVSASASTTAANGTLNVVKIHALDWRVSYYTLTNTSGVTVSTSGTRFALVHQGYLYLKAYSSPYNLYSFELGNEANCSIFKTVGFSGLNGVFAYAINGRVYLEYLSSTSSYDRLYIANANNKEILTSEIGYIWNYRYYACYTPVLNEPLLWFSSMGNYSTGGFFILTNYLATINNLSEPVTKTADKTMKVTYIIQEQ